MKHTNVDALSRNPVGEAQEDDDFYEEIRDVNSGPGNSVAMTRGICSVQFDEEGYSPDEGSEAVGDDGIPHSESFRTKQIVCRGATKYYNKEQQLELVLAAQGLAYNDAHQDSDSRSEEAAADDSNQTDIWEDAMSDPANTNCSDDHLAKVLFGYRCGVQANTKLSLYMILTGQSPRLRVDNHLNTLTNAIDDSSSVENAAEQFLEKVKLIVSIHKNVLLNVDKAQKKQRGTYANRSGKHLFEGLVAGVSMVKMKIPSKRRALSASWEGPYQFIGHADGKGDFDFEEGCRICVV
ncbi:unnamed protein product [Sphagnum jensenii]|uniref:Uncharacterized protein n=1 Tax=Sphagnum jensenii TaxID=128206 RepID=A0ABP1AM32_9BRYO